MERKTVPCRLPPKLWAKIVVIAKAERRSGQAQLEIVVERGLGSVAEWELRRLSGERANRVMDEMDVDKI